MKKLLIILFSFIFFVISFICVFRMSQKTNPQFDIQIIIDYLEEFNGFQRTINEVENVKITFNTIKEMPEFSWSGDIAADVVALFEYLIDIIVWWFFTLWSIIKALVNLILDIIDIVLWVLSFPSYLLK